MSMSHGIITLKCGVVSGQPLKVKSYPLIIIVIIMLVVHRELTMTRSVHSAVTGHVALHPKAGSTQAPAGVASTINIEMINNNNNQKHK